MTLVFPLPGHRRPFQSARKEDSVMIKIIHGKVHGKTIELDEDLGVPERQELQVRFIPKPNRMPVNGFGCTEGALAKDEEWDEIMDEIYQARK